MNHYWPTRVIQVIETWDLRGSGTASSPVRRVRQFWTFDGELICEFDPEKEISSKGSL